MIAPIIAGLVVAALGFMGWLFYIAPVGYEDDDGWHEGEPKTDRDRGWKPDDCSDYDPL